MEVDRNGFVVGPSVASSLPEWQLTQMKQEQRLQKWRSMLGKLYLSIIVLCTSSSLERIGPHNQGLHRSGKLWILQAQGHLTGSNTPPSMQPR